MTAALSRDEARAAGLRLYFSGSTCKRGHSDGRRVSNGVCITCDWIDKRSARYKATAKAYFQSDRGKTALRRHSASPTAAARLARYKKEGRDKEWQRRHYATGRKRQTLNAWGKRNRHKTRVWYARYQAAKLQATPPWLTGEDLVNIAAIYAEAVARGLSVDHIVPLRGKNVCGLHVPWNLQLLTQAENSRKNAKFAEPGEIPPSRRRPDQPPAPRGHDEALL